MTREVYFGELKDGVLDEIENEANFYMIGNILDDICQHEKYLNFINSVKLDTIFDVNTKEFKKMKGIIIDLCTQMDHWSETIVLNRLNMSNKLAFMVKEEEEKSIMDNINNFVKESEDG